MSPVKMRCLSCGEIIEELLTSEQGKAVCPACHKVDVTVAILGESEQVDTTKRGRNG